MRRRLLPIAALLIAVATILVWWGRPSSTSPSVADAQTARRTVKRTVFEQAPAAQPNDPDLVYDAATGELGLDLMRRVCIQCRAGNLVDEGCRACPAEDVPQGYVTVDLVDQDGRPYPPHEGTVRAGCANRAVITSGRMVLPEGPCELFGTRVDGLLTARGEPQVVHVRADEEQYVLVELPRTPWGAAGVDLTFDGEGRVVVRSAIEGTEGERLPVGAHILVVDGRPVEHVDLTTVAEHLNGPVGSDVEIQYEDPDTGETHTVVLTRSRLDNRVVSPGMVPG